MTFDRTISCSGDHKSPRSRWRQPARVVDQSLAWPETTGYETSEARAGTRQVHFLFELLVRGTRTASPLSPLMFLVRGLWLHATPSGYGICIGNDEQHSLARQRVGKKGWGRHRARGWGGWEAGEGAGGGWAGGVPRV